jgi:hypothetical protein
MKLWIYISSYMMVISSSIYAPLCCYRTSSLPPSYCSIATVPGALIGVAFGTLAMYLSVHLYKRTLLAQSSLSVSTLFLAYCLSPLPFMLFSLLSIDLISFHLNSR